MNKDLLPLHQLLTKKDTTAWRHYWQLGQGTTDIALHYPHTITALIKIIRTSKAKRIFLLHKDRAYFLAGFLATLQLHLPLVLPPQDSPAFLKELMQPGDCLLTDQEELRTIGSLFISMNEIQPDDEITSFTELNPQNTKIVFYTSGSTNVPKCVEKSLAQLEAEVAVLQTTWPTQQNLFLSTVTHQHIYGLLFSLLWPVCAGAPLKRQTFSFWEDLLAHLENDAYVISSPSHLGRFPLLTQPAFPVARIFSSAGLLSFEAPQTTQQYFGVLPTEVYGSTETGGIAYRQQKNQSEPWQRFSPIKIDVDADQILTIQSPYLPDNHLYTTDDRAELLNADQFHLLGRADRVVKIEGKRVSLIAMEQQLMLLKEIEEVVVCVLENLQRNELGAVVVLSAAGRNKIAQMGKISFVRELRKKLSAYFDRVVIPKKWRFVEVMPMNAEGKRTLKMLQELFIPSPTIKQMPLQKTHYPKILKQSHLSENEVEILIQIPKDLPYFEGHFHHMPVVAGVVQLHWVVKFAARFFNIPDLVSHASQIKFTRLMRPEDELCLTLTHTPEKKMVSYRYQTSEHVYSMGRYGYEIKGDVGV